MLDTKDIGKSINESMTLNFGKVIGKLHLAAKGQITGDVTIKNTAIINDKPNDTAENPGETSFDFELAGKEDPTVYIAYGDVELDFYPIDFNRDSKYLELKEKNDQEGMKKREDELNEMSVENQKKSEEAIKQKVSDALANMKTYYENFLGKDKIKKLSNEKDIVFQEIDPNSLQGKDGFEMIPIQPKTQEDRAENCYKTGDYKINPCFVAITKYKFDTKI